MVAIADRLGRHKSQVSRALRALEAEGMVERDPQTLEYRLGSRLYTLASRTREARLVRVAGPHLRDLVHDLQETAHLCVLRGDRVVTLHSEVCTALFRGGGWDGTAVPVPETIAGRVLLLDWSADQVRAWFGSDADAAMLESSAAVRRDGYARVLEELAPGLVGVAAPVLDEHGLVLAAISVASPTERLGGGLEQAGARTARTARELSAVLRRDPV